MKTLQLLLISAFVFTAQLASSQELDSLQNQVKKLFKYYESYENGSPESLKKANFEDAAKEISNGTATQKDINDAFKVVDWYIRSDKAIGEEKDGSPNPKPKPDHNDLDEYLENTDQAKAAMDHVNQQKNKLYNMSYSEFEAYVLTANPVAGKADIKKAYNQMHKTDGKQVAISEKDNEMTETQKQVWAFDVLNNPKDYAEFLKACKILNPNYPEEEIKKEWDKRHK